MKENSSDKKANSANNLVDKVQDSFNRAKNLINSYEEFTDRYGKQKFWQGFFMGVGVVGLAAYVIIQAGLMKRYHSLNLIPNVKHVQNEYVIPNELCIPVRDVNSDGNLQTMLNYRNVEYHLKYDGNNVYLVPNEK